MFEGIKEKRNIAFLYLYTHQIDSIVNLVGKNNGDEQDAKDIFQEGMIALWINIRKGNYKLDAQVKLSTYLYSVCRNLWLKKLRSKKTMVPINESEDKIGSIVPETFDEVNERFVQLRSHLSRLGEKCQTILNLFYYQKASIKVIAEQFSYGEKTAKNEKYRCMQRLRKMYN